MGSAIDNHPNFKALCTTVDMVLELVTISAKNAQLLNALGFLGIKFYYLFNRSTNTNFKKFW